MDETKTINPFLDDALDFDAIYDRYFDRVFQFILYRVGNREVAKDLASDIFLKIYKKLSTYHPEKGSFDAWIFTIAGNHVKDYYRKKNRFQWLPIAAVRDIPDPVARSEELVEEREEIEYLRRAVKKLRLDDQLLISYKFGAELSNQTIAELIHTNPNHVGVMIHRLVNRLRKEMEAYYEGTT